MNKAFCRTDTFTCEPTSWQVVNDTHSKLNRTLMRSIDAPETEAELLAVVRRAISDKESVSIAGGRHAMGGQQFLQNASLIDTTRLNRVMKFDAENGLLKVQAGANWPEIIAWLQSNQSARQTPWTIAQKQTGCDHLSIGGALSANVHGRGLSMRPVIGDIEQFSLITADGSKLQCSRTENKDLFNLAIGGYGMFGVIADATLRLSPRTVLQRSVKLINAAEAVKTLEMRRDEGALYGDFQFAIDNNSDDFLNKGIVSTYKPVEDAPPPGEDKRLLSIKAWKELVYLAHTDKNSAFKRYADHYLSTDGQTYWSDTFQLSTYLDDYHTEIDSRAPKHCHGTEMISELYVPRHCLASFLADAAVTLRERNASVIYGTVRLIERDSETFLPWASESWACTVINLHVEHTATGLQHARDCFRALIDIARKYGGSYYLTYHKFATKEQMLDCYPQMPRFIALKQHYDPRATFSSDWINYCRQITS
ncbi:MAG: FAD-binding oxidoreductase [Candidatus Obscuribacterales bacterium]|nr:FAD-binding oxidoreductase [Candidatus Obscuribacterales bacterium]